MSNVTVELREALAAVSHEIWAHWMTYMLSQGKFMYGNEEGAGLANVKPIWVMLADKLERWQRQMNTPYAALTEQERESDRHQADKILAVLPAVPATVPPVPVILDDVRETLLSALNTEQSIAEDENKEWRVTPEVYAATIAGIDAARAWLDSLEATE